MKLTIEEREGKKIEITTDATDIYEVLEEIKNLLAGAGFHACSIRDGFIAMAENYQSENTCNCDDCNKEKE